LKATASACDAIDADSLTTALQPIVSLSGARVFAFEALTRARPGVDVAELFDHAVGCGCAIPLNLVGIRNALNAARGLAKEAFLFVNADPIVLTSVHLPRVIRESAARSGFPLSRLVVEITERSAFADVPATMRVLDDLRASVVRFALDDFGSAHSHLALVDAIRPSFLKIGHGFGTAFEESATRSLIVRSFVSLARDLACSTILEGIESAATARAARALGIEYAQGYHFGAPVSECGHSAQIRPARIA
jgi:EAL domain-containing protein (putative c-di-GMP-specific phosphodiesterase class I)